MTYAESMDKINNFKLILIMLRKSKNVSDVEYIEFEKKIHKEWNDVIAEYRKSRKSKPV